MTVTVFTALSGWQLRPGCGMTISPNPYRGFRFPAVVIEHAVWLYHCFSLSLRDVELILAARGIVVSYESIREWSLRFGRVFANALKRAGHNPATSGTWTRCSSGSAASNTIFGAVDQDGNVWTFWSRAGATQQRPCGS